MQIQYSQLLEVFKHGDELVLCRIEVLPRSVIYYHEQANQYETHRWMQAEDWAHFEDGLEKILANCKDDTVTNFSAKEEKLFQLNALVQVRVRRSFAPYENLVNFISHELDYNMIALALDCSIVYSKNGWQGSNDNKESIAQIEANELEDNKYETQFDYSSNSALDLNTSNSALAYVPYTPSKNSKKDSYSTMDSVATPGTGLLDINIDEPLINSSSDMIINETPSPYNPRRIKTRSNSISIAKSSVETTVKSSSPKSKTKKSKSKLKVTEHTVDEEAILEEEIMEITDSQNVPVIETEKEGVEKKKKKKSKRDKDHTDQANANIPICSESIENSNIIGLTEKRKRNIVNYIDKTPSKDLRRSSRSPIKPLRFITDDLPAVSKRTKSKSPVLHKKRKKIEHKNLFSSDEDENGVFETKTPKTPLGTKLPKTPSSSDSGNRKRDKGTDCQKEKKAMNVWLTKKESVPTSPVLSVRLCGGGPGGSGKTIVKASKSAEKANKEQPIVYPSSQEIEERIIKEKEQIANNKQLKALLEQWAGPPPEKVETLTLDDMSRNEILTTFTKHQPLLDEIYEKFQRKTQVRGNDGCDHYLVIGLVEHSTELKLMEKLSDVYEKNKEGSSTCAQLFANAMMPEWILAIFMDKFKLTRKDAIKQLKAQEEYRIHLDAQNEDNSFFNI